MNAAIVDKRYLENYTPPTKLITETIIKNSLSLIITIFNLGFMWGITSSSIKSGSINSVVL